MKTLVILLGMTCFLVSVYPCCIIDECENDSVEVKNQNKQESNECESCSPFISCGVCVGFVQNHLKQSVPNILLPVKLENSFAFYFNYLGTEYAEQLWQPPKKVIIS